MKKLITSVILIVFVIAFAGVAVVQAADNAGGDQDLATGTNKDSCPMMSSDDLSDHEMMAGMHEMMMSGEMPESCMMDGEMLESCMMDGEMLESCTMDGEMLESCTMDGDNEASMNCPMSDETTDVAESINKMDMSGHDKLGTADVDEQLYVCPMHPDEISDNPDEGCSICGMNLEELEQTDGNEGHMNHGH